MKKQYYAYIRTTLFSDFRLSFKNYLEHLTADFIVFFVFVTVNNTARLQVHLYFYADVTSEGNITGGG